MLASFTPAVETALRNAGALASSEGGAEVQPVHLLHGLLCETEGRAAHALAAAGMTGAFPPGPPVQEEAETLPLGQAVQEILGEARELARDLSDDHNVTTDLVLYALLHQDRALRATLEERGLDFARLEAGLLAGRKTPLALDEPLHLADMAERVDAARVLDAAANRAREALRVVEDYCRFVLDDALLSKELKELRHELTEILAAVPAVDLLQARETLQDVGTALTTEAEQHRHSLPAVAQANLKRLEEALRSLEEFGKFRHPALGQRLEQLRYRTYTLEKAILLGTAARQRLADARLYVLVTGARCAAALDWTIHEAAAGGAQVIQLREKELPDRELVERARQVRRWTRQAGVLFIMNDRPDVARLVEADGVHLGQDDLAVRDARRLVGPDVLVGVSTHHLEQVRQAVLEGASYIGVGPTFPSGTKAFAELAGLPFVRQAAEATSLPAFVLGGITLDNLPAALAAGARRVAVSQAICQADDPRAVAAQFRSLLDSHGGSQ
jgi:thiamine-phosphate pyrophosphorylase